MSTAEFERLPQLANDLLAAKPEVLLVQSTPANLAAKAATQIVPIVMVGVADPVGVGLYRQPRAAGRQYHRHH